MSPADYAQEQGFFDLLKVMGEYSAVPPAISDVKTAVNEKTVKVIVKLPPSRKDCPLFKYKSVQVNYKKATFLAKNESVVVDLSAYFKEKGESDSVEVDLTELSNEVSYQIKARLENENGWGGWSGGVECKLDSESSDSDKESPSSESETSSETSSESSSDSSSESEEEPKPKSKGKALKRAEKKGEPKSKPASKPESKPKSESKPESKPKSEPKPEPKQIAKSEIKSEIKSEPKQEDKPNEPEPKPEAKVEPATPDAASLLAFLQSNNLAPLEQLAPSLFTSFRTADGLPLLHALILNSTNPHTTKPALRLLLSKGCDLNEDVRTVRLWEWDKP